MGDKQPHIIIVGAGLSGLAASLEVERLGGRVTLLDRTDTIGGRVKTDIMKGFLLDRGFQVLLTSYPELKRLQILDSLNLGAFRSGAICHKDDSAYVVMNPLRHFSQFLMQIHQLPSPIYLDLLKLARICLSKAFLSESTDKLLKDRGISFEARHYFLEPFFGGVFLDTKLEARAQIFVEYLRLFSRGVATLPQQGMKALPKAIHRKLDNTRLLLNEEVKEVAETGVFLASGKKIFADAIIVAVDNPALEAWLESPNKTESQSVRCFYFSTLRGQIKKAPYLHLGNDGPIKNLCIPNHAQPSYAPKDFDLISATVVDEEWQKRPDIARLVEENASYWLSISERNLSLIKSYNIKHALPNQKEPPMFEDEIRMKGFERVFLAGEAVEPPSINGALRSGRRAGRVAMTAVTPCQARPLT